MTVYEAMVESQSIQAGTIVQHFEAMERHPDSAPFIKLYQESIDRAYLLGIAIDNLRCDIATIEV